MPPSETRDVHGITDEQKALIKAFLQGAVYSWGKNRSGEKFAARDLVGGENYEWRGTPMVALYQKHIARGKSSDASVDAAGQYLGWLLKAVLAEDKRHFEADRSGRTAAYRWVGNEP